MRLPFFSEMGNSMGLILEARSSLSFFESVAYGKAVIRVDGLSQKPCQRGRTLFKTLALSHELIIRSRDDIKS